MKSRIAVIAAALAVAIGSVAPAAQTPQPPERVGGTTRSPEALDPPELRVLLSSIGMTVSLIDAYGRCREKDKTHDQCMALIRTTLTHARQMIGR